MQKADSNSSAGYVADSSTKDDNLQSSSHDTKPNVVGSQSHGTLIEISIYQDDVEIDKLAMSRNTLENMMGQTTA